MAVRFVIGRAGAGKTAHCLEAVRDSLTESPLAGPSLLLLVPEQAALQTERALIADPGPRAVHRARACGFRRLADQILAEGGGLRPRVLSADGRTMTLRYLLDRLSDRLGYYRRLDRVNGFINELAQAIGELFEEAVTPDDLHAAAEAAAGDPQRGRKLADLHLVYTAYLEHLGQTRLDPSQHLAVARERVVRCSSLAGARVYVDGFAGLTRQETLLLVSLARVAASVEITILLDPEVVEAIQPSEVRLGQDDPRLFARPLHTWCRLHQALVEAQVEIERPLLLRPRQPTRFTDAPDLTTLERHLFAEESPRDDDPPAEREAAVELVEVPDLRIEVDYAVSRLVQWVRESATPLRYRDVAIIVRNLDPYADLLGAALADRNIPFFIDRRRTTGHHPLVELLRSLVTMPAESMSLDAVRPALKTGLLGLTDEAADELENFILAHGIAGLETWTSGDWSPIDSEQRVGPIVAAGSQPGAEDLASLRRVNNARREILGHLAEWLSFAREARSLTGRDWATALARLLQETLAVPQQLAHWAHEAADDGDLDAAEEHRQIWRDTATFLDDLTDALGDQPMNLSDLATVLEAGLAQFTLGLAPPMLDQVLVGEIERSRHPEIKAAIILGFTDRDFPSSGGENSILNDDDRKFLTEYGLPIGRPRRQRVLDERLLVYVALTRASRTLLVTWPATDAKGTPQRPSPFAADLRRACPGLVEHVVSDSQLSRATWPLLSAPDLAASLTREFRSRPPLNEDDAGLRSVWNAIYDSARCDGELRPALSGALASLAYENTASLAPDTVAALQVRPFETSVSQLETFAACPFRYFAQQILRLKPRRCADLEQTDVGKLHHAILEDFIGALIGQNRTLGQLDDSEVLAGLAASCQRVTIRPLLEGGLSNAREAYLARRSREDLARVLRAQQRTLAAGRYQQHRAEQPFGFESRNPDSLPALEIDTPAGRRIFLRGYIDRVDLAELADELLGVVVDYKRHSREKKLDVAQVYHGLSLQLLSYLLALEQHGRTLAGRPIRPAAAFYVSLVPAYKSLGHPEDLDESEDAAWRVHRPSGFFSVDCLEALDSAGAGSKSAVLNAYVKDGRIMNEGRSDAVEPDLFGGLLDHTRRRLGELADGVLDGDVRVRPYRLNDFSPCTWCDFRSVCCFEWGQPGVRLLPRISRAELSAKLNDSSEEMAP